MEQQGLIWQRYPDTTFEVVDGDDPTGIYVLATVDVEDTEAVVDVYIDRLLELQIDAVLAVYVVPVRPLARILASAGAIFSNSSNKAEWRDDNDH
jgi:hypothetical protein